MGEKEKLTEPTEEIYSKNEDVKLTDTSESGSTETKTSIRTFVNPSSLAFETGSLIWIILEAIPIYKLSNHARAPNAIAKVGDVSENSFGDSASSATKDKTALALELNASRYRFKFLLAGDIPETLTHQWEPYESAASKVAGLAVGMGSSVTQIGSALQGVVGKNGTVGDLVTKTGKGVQYLVTGNDSMGEKAKATLQTLKTIATGIATGGVVANYRIDTPLQYKGSNRREFELQFVLIKTSNTEGDVSIPVKMLQSLSSPAYPEDGNMVNADIILPYLFKIKTEPGNLIFSDLAVLKQVQPTWKGPYIDGEPTRCELRLSFQEYRPLEQSVFFSEGQRGEGGIVKAYLEERKTAYAEAENNTKTGSTSNEGTTKLDYNKTYYGVGGDKNKLNTTW